MAISTSPPISAFDRVELVDAIEEVPAGARGAVLEVRDASTALVEITEPRLDAVDSIVFVPLAQLRRR